jgi:protein AroM
MGKTLGILTIGQSPRPDGLARDVQKVLGTGVQVIERGALDGLSRKEVDALQPGESDYRLITLLNDHTPVQIAKKPILYRLQRHITDLERNCGIDATLLMCTGEFPHFDHERPLIKPQESLYGVVKGLAGGGTVGSLTPLESQLSQARDKWLSMGYTDVALADADPYCDDPIQAVTSATEKVRSEGASVLFMDCFGYDLRMGAAATAVFDGPVILARSMAARIASEVIE